MAQESGTRAASTLINPPLFASIHPEAGVFEAHVAGNEQDQARFAASPWECSMHRPLFGRLQPCRNVAACMQYPPDVDVIIALYVEDQIGIRLQLPTT